MIREEDVHDDGNFVAITPDGKRINCQILFTFDSYDFGKSYVVYTDNTLDMNGELRTYASVYDPSGDGYALKEIETQEEWDMIDTLLADY